MHEIRDHTRKSTMWNKQNPKQINKTLRRKGREGILSSKTKQFPRVETHECSTWKVPLGGWKKSEFWAQGARRGRKWLGICFCRAPCTRSLTCHIRWIVLSPFCRVNHDLFHEEFSLHHSDQSLYWWGVQRERMQQIMFCQEKKMLDSDCTSVYGGT